MKPLAFFLALLALTLSNDAFAYPTNGLASFYGLEACQFNVDPRCPTASGKSLYELEKKGIPYAASWFYPFGTRLKVCRKDNRGKCVDVIVLDRGPSRRFKKRIVDLSKQAFAELAPLKQGLVEITVNEI